MENTVSRWLCTFEIDNNQDGYAQCLKQVLRLEDISKSKNYNDCVQNDFLEFYISRWKNNNINSETFIIQQEEIIKNIDKHTIKKIESEKGLLEGLKIDNPNHMFYYYIRVNMDNIDSDITNLMYLVLSLQTLEKINDRIVVYFYTTQNKFSLYFKLTHFLRLIIEHYTFMYASIDDKSVKLLKNENEYIQKTFFPILEVDENLYDVFNRSWNVNFDEPFDKFDNLYDKITIYQENKEIDDLTCLIFKTSFRMLFDNLDGRKYPQFNNKNKLLNSIHNLISSNQGVTPLEMLLFGSLIVNEDKKFDENNSEELLKNIKNLSTAIMQIIENIVNHSEHKTGVFTLRLHNKNNKEYLNNNYPGYPVESSDTCIEVLIADSNTKDNIIEHFVQGDKSADIVKKHKKQIYLCDFFGDYYAQNGKIWGEARKENPEMCNGLLIYAQTIKKLNGATFVRSSHKFNNADTKNIYYFCKNNGLDSKKYNKLCYIPGTQFSLVFNKNFLLNHIFKNDKKYNFNKMLYSTTYRQLAQTLLFDNGAYEININNINTNIESQTDKDNRVKEIQDVFNEVYNKVYNNASDSCEEVKYNVFICDLGEYSKKSLNNNTLNEILSKSILSSKLCMETKNYNCLLLKNTNEAIKEYLNNTLKIMEYKSNLKLEHTCIYIYPYSSREQIDNDSEDDLPYFATSIPDPLNNKEIFPEIFPYMLINKHNDEDNKKTQFEEMMSRQANISIYKNGKQGYKIANTHMRLGNKVHLDAFYEMALFFENPNYASYASYLLIKKIINNIDAEQKLIFYGYASYSRAMVWAAIQIIKEYFELIKTKCPEMEFIIYQNDLKEETNVPQEQMYYSNKDWQKDHSKVWKDNSTKLIMIVPISSSLTTFDKMNAELLREINITDEDKYFHNVEYYTTFWVRNKHIDEKQEVEQPTDEEKEFWTRVNLNKRQIFRINGDKIINYFVSEKCAWENPLKCKKCFPKNALNEKPLVETDPTSTVPTQQLYIEDIKNDNSDIKIDIDNELRIAALYNNILYKHISKCGNHFQFYIKTKEYFLQQCVDVKNWLNDLKDSKREDDDKTINVLIIPQQANNVEFGQYVYEYYFDGNAECIIINTEKEFRSNLEAEYSGLFKRLYTMNKEGYKIKFHYVDVAICSGNSFSRAVSLLLPIIKRINDCNTNNCIESVFLLINRMSDSSKYFYVKNGKDNFHSYVELQISSMRNFGDSCVLCKLYNEAESFYKKAATKSISQYWDDKMYNRRSISFDKSDDSFENEQEKEKNQKNGYLRMICSHRLAHFIRPTQGKEIEAYARAIRDFIGDLLDENKNDIYIHNEESLKNIDICDWLIAGLKVMSRPFFSYDYKLKTIVMDIFIILMELTINQGENTIESIETELRKSKPYWFVDNNLHWIRNLFDKVIGTNKNNILDIMEGLTDLKSNYLLRKNNIVKISNYIYDNDINNKYEFYENYVKYILKIVNSSSDETKSLWLEYILQYGREYNSELITLNIEKNLSGIEIITNACNSNSENQKCEFKELLQILEVLVIENNRPVFQIVKELSKELGRLKEKDKEKVKEIISKRYLKNAKDFLSINNENIDIEDLLLSLSNLYELLQGRGNEGKEKDSRDADQYYVNLGEKIHDIVKCYDPQGKLILFGIGDSDSNDYLKLPAYFVLYHYLMNNSKIDFEDQNLYSEVWSKLSDKDRLEKIGFCITHGDDDLNIFIKLDNNHQADDNHNFHPKIEPIYMFISCKTTYSNGLKLIRNLLMFRTKLIDWLEKDFNNNSMALLSKQKNLAILLSQDKIGDHAENKFVDCQQRLLLMDNIERFKEGYEKKLWEKTVSLDGTEIDNAYQLMLDWEEFKLSELDFKLFENQSEIKEWFFMRSYINSRISRMYRTMVRNTDDFENYYSRDGQAVELRPATDLCTLFFTPLYVGLIRENYLYQIMKTVCFYVEDEADYDFDTTETDINYRLKKLSKMLKKYKCVSIDENGKHYAYLAEYISIILMDCFVSAVKAGEVWNTTSWGAEAFVILNSAKASKKCKIEIYREEGGKKYDYLVIKNDVYKASLYAKKSLGMSQAAIKWYIEEFWKHNNAEGPIKVITDQSCKDCYLIKLPILEKNNNNNI